MWVKVSLVFSLMIFPEIAAACSFDTDCQPGAQTVEVAGAGDWDRLIPYEYQIR